VTAPVLRRHPGIACHRGQLTGADRDERFGIPVTSPSRTLADLAHVLPLDDLVRAFREAQFRRLYDRAALTETLMRRPSKHLKELMEDAAVTQSRLEDDFKALCKRYRIEPPRTQYSIGARRYDFVWPEPRLVVETDSWQAHGTPFAFQNDRSVSNVLQLEGWTILRFTSRDVTRRKRHVAATVRAALSRSAARSASSAPAPRRPRPRPARAAS
jgi:very-short-patch-repair endonuclease